MTAIKTEFPNSEEHIRIEESIAVDGKIFLGIEDRDRGEHTSGDGRYVHIDPNELRDAIDKAVGPREEPEPWEGRKPYRPLDRDRLLRHIEDVEAALTRRNERHEQDQERIRELEAEVFTLREIKDSYEEPKTVREYLDLAWEVAVEPEDGVIHVGEAFLCKDGSGIRQPVLGNAGHAISANDCGVERRLMEPRVEPTPEERRQAIIDERGLEDWELELLAGPAS